MKTHGLTIKLIAKKPKNGRNCESRVNNFLQDFRCDKAMPGPRKALITTPSRDG
jgi:hypothetical protein